MGFMKAHTRTDRDPAPATCNEVAMLRVPDERPGVGARPHAGTGVRGRGRPAPGRAVRKQGDTRTEGPT
jgi:hypothetical protein